MRLETRLVDFVDKKLNIWYNKNTAIKFDVTVRFER